MNLAKIKNLVKQNGDKFIFVENGEPEMVMMSFQEYEKLARSDSDLRMRSSNDSNSRYLNHSGATFESLELPLGSFEPPLGETEFMVSQGEEIVGLPVRTEDIRLEDLPI